MWNNENCRPDLYANVSVLDFFASNKNSVNVLICNWKIRIIIIENTPCTVCSEDQQTTSL